MPHLPQAVPPDGPSPPKSTIPELTPTPSGSSSPPATTTTAAASTATEPTSPVPSTTEPTAYTGSTDSGSGSNSPSPTPQQIPPDFRKKNVKPRTQLFQLVLSTASLKSLQQPRTLLQPSVPTSTPGPASTPGITGPGTIGPPSRPDDIGRHLPFDTPKESPPEDLTLNALKRLQRPYQPAEVDLSTFASLTRQPDRVPASPMRARPGASVISGFDRRVSGVSSSASLGSLVADRPPAPIPEATGRTVPATAAPTAHPIAYPATQGPTNAGPTSSNTAIAGPAAIHSVSSAASLPNATTQGPAGGAAGTTGGAVGTGHSLRQIKNLRSPMYIPAVLRKTDDDSDLVRLVDLAVLADVPHEQYQGQPPTRRHWVKDETVYKCSAEGCHKEFNFFERRHHCRKCGRIFCKEHTSHFLYINHLAQFTTGGRGTLSRVCDLCIHEYNEFMQSQFGMVRNVAQPVMVYDKVVVSQEPLGSVPANWLWSSF